MNENRISLVRTTEGCFSLALPEGPYGLRAHAPGLGDFDGSLTVSGERTRFSVTLSRPSTCAPPEVQSWIRQHRVALGSCIPDADPHVLASLGVRVGKARVVALGEPAHGISEFIRLKHRIFAYLVARKGFTILAMEADPVPMEVLDAYLLEGQGGLDEAMAGLDFWCGSTREFRDLFQWIRDYNLDLRHPRKVRVRGIDVRSFAPAQARLVAFLSEVDAAAALQAAALREPSGDGPELEACRASLKDLLIRLDAQKSLYCPRMGAFSGRHGS